MIMYAENLVMTLVETNKNETIMRLVACCSRAPAFVLNSRICKCFSCAFFKQNYRDCLYKIQYIK